MLGGISSNHIESMTWVTVTLVRVWVAEWGDNAIVSLVKHNGLIIGG
jgi:hypothetical protein